MQIASALAGYTLGEADILRKAMGKKKADVMATQMDKFLKGCAARGVTEKKASKIWDHMEQFAGYGFNKSHSAAYAWLAYQTAYLKANYPAYFMAALLTSERANTDKMVQYIGECREMGIRVLPPDVNESDIFFTVVGAGERRHPLRPGRHQERGRGRGGGGAARPPRGRAASVAVRLLRARRPAGGEPAGGGELHQERLLRLARRAAGRARSPPSTAAMEVGPEAAARPGAGTVEPARDAAGRRRGRRPAPERLRDAAGLGRGRAAGLREGVAGLLHHRPSPGALPRRAGAVGHRHHRPPGRAGRPRGHGGRDHHRAAPHQDQEGRPHGDLRPGGPGGRRWRCWSSRRPTRRSRAAWPRTRSCW